MRPTRPARPRSRRSERSRRRRSTSRSPATSRARRRSTGRARAQVRPVPARRRAAGRRQAARADRVAPEDHRAVAATRRRRPSLLFRLGELYWEESKDYFFEANRKDDDLIRGAEREGRGRQERAKAEKAELMVQRKAYAKLAVDQYTKIVQKYQDFERTDEVLFFLGHNLMDLDERERKALVAYKLVNEVPEVAASCPTRTWPSASTTSTTRRASATGCRRRSRRTRTRPSTPRARSTASPSTSRAGATSTWPTTRRRWTCSRPSSSTASSPAPRRWRRTAARAARTPSSREARNDYVRAYARAG